ncbi:MAG: MFS transporter [Moraxellaceae bacterium]|nr:MFS transporter [Moraxellaceae bacterium]
MSTFTNWLINRDFACYFGVRLLTMGGFQMLAVAVGWQLYDMTGSMMDLGLVGLVGFLPSLLLMLLVGHVADHYNRRVIVQWCNVVQALVAGALALGSWQGWLTREGIFLASFLLGASKAFSSPTLAAMLPALVKPDDLPRAVSASSAAMQVSIIAGPALGGLLYLGGAVTVYGITATFYLASALLLALIHYAPPVQEKTSEHDDSVFAGLRYVWRKPVLFGAISLDLFAVLLGGATAMLPVIAKNLLHTGPEGLGLLRAAPAVGALAVSFALTRFPIERHAGRVMFAGVAVFGASTVVLGLSTSLVLSVASLLVLGAADMLSVVIRSSLVQLETPEDMRGRVNAVNFLFIGASNQLGEFRSGASAALMGLVPSIVLGGVGTLVVAGLWMWWFPALARRDRLVEKV